jgi:hypothetical protein
MTPQNDTKDVQLARGGDMAWKKALFFGGAVLLLAACSDATAPSATLRNGRPAAAAIMRDGPTTQWAPADGTVNDLGDDLCRSGYYVRSGDRDVCVLSLDPM